MLELPRADDLRLLRNICHFLHSQEHGRSTIQGLCQWLSSCAHEVFTRDWKKSRIYHYTSAALALDLMHKLDEHHFALTGPGHELVECRNAPPTPTAVLSPAERHVLMACIFRSQAMQRYLSFYMPRGQPPQSPAAFARKAKPIALVRHDERSFALTTASGEMIALTPSEKKSYAWTLFNWLKTLGLVDDIYSEHPASFILRAPERRVFYPVQPRPIAVADIERILIERARKLRRRVVLFYIPELMLEVCTAHRIPKQVFQDALLTLNKQDPVRFNLIMMSRLRSDDRCLRHYRYDNFPRVKGILRSHLCIRADLGPEATHD